MATSRQPTILYIHDDKRALHLRAANLESAGYCVHTAFTADSAMAVFVEHEIDLVIAEHLVGGVSGAELSIFMKQLRPAVAVIVISGRSLPAAFAKHVDAYIPAACSEQEFLDCVETVLGQTTPSEVAS